MLTQKTALATFFHTIPSAAFTAGAFIAGISAYLIIKKRDAEMARSTFKMGAITMLVSFILVGVSGDLTARVMTEQQPMKMAAAEALYNSQNNAPFSLLTIGTLDGSKSVFQIGVPPLRICHKASRAKSAPIVPKPIINRNDQYARGIFGV